MYASDAEPVKIQTAKGQLISEWRLQFFKKTTQKFDGILPYNLKIGTIKKIKAPYYVIYILITN